MKMSLSRSAFPFLFLNLTSKPPCSTNTPRSDTHCISFMIIIPRGDCLNVWLCMCAFKQEEEEGEGEGQGEARFIFFCPGLCERVEGQAWRWCLWWWWWWQEEHQRSEPLNLPGESPVETALISARCRSNSGLNVLCSWNGACITEGLMTLFRHRVRLQGGGTSGSVPLLRFFSHQSTCTLPETPRVQTSSYFLES